MSRTQRTVTIAGLAAVVLLVATGWWLHSVLPASPEDLEDRVADRSGVADVVVVEPEGDDGIPGQTIPQEITVTMDEGASAAQVRAVFHAYDDDFDAFDVGLVTVTAPRATGEDVSITLNRDDDIDERVVDGLFVTTSAPGSG
jgi:hypothetical protein